MNVVIWIYWLIWEYGRMLHCTVDLQEHCNYNLSLQLQAGAPCCNTTAILKALYKIWDLFDLKKESIPCVCIMHFPASNTYCSLSLIFLWIVTSPAGSIGSELTTSNVSVYITSDAGNTWRQVRVLFYFDHVLLFKSNSNLDYLKFLCD